MSDQTTASSDPTGMSAQARAELTALASTLEETTRRLGSIAEAAADDERSPSRELFEIERELLGASRRLDALVRRLDGRR